MKKHERKVGLALGGGGARGLAHLGVLKVLEREKIPIDCIAGTSMGAFVGGAYSQLADIKTLEEKARRYFSEVGVEGEWLNFLGKDGNQRRKNLFQNLSQFILKKYVSFLTLSRSHLESEEALLGPLRIFLDDKRIEEGKIPFCAVCLDLVSGEELTLDRGNIIEAVYASSAIEGVFPPLERGGRLLADGGPTSQVPVEAARRMGADIILAVDLPKEIKAEREFKNGLDLILRAEAIAVEKLKRLTLKLADVIITPEVRSIHWANFNKVEECIAQGVKATEQRLPEIRAILKRKPSPLSDLRKRLGELIAGS
jgi:NTE family protein